MGLTDIQEGKTVRVMKIKGGRGLRKKLMALGIISGVPIKLVNANS